MNELVLSVVASFIIMVFINFLPRKTDQKIIFHFGGKCYHLHHWITGIFLLLFAFLVRHIDTYTFNIIIGVIIGFVLEGFLFEDMFKIMVKC